MTEPDIILATLNHLADRAWPTTHPSKMWMGEEVWTLPNGWRLWVFIDAGDWDYVARVEDADGNVLWRYEDHELNVTTEQAVAWARIANWLPPNPDAWPWGPVNVAP